MIRFLAILALFFFGLSAHAQSSSLLIARNTGKKVLHDSVSVRSFGFAQKLSENPGIPGPTLVYTEGDSVTIDLWNVSQGAPHTIHLHGLDVDQQNDGVPHLSFTVKHMKHGYYRFKAPHPGTYLYHCHVVSAIHVQAGMYGLVIIKPKTDPNTTWEGGYSFYKDYSYLMSEIDTVWHHDSVLLHDTAAMHIPVPDFNPTYFMVNGLSQQQLRDSQNQFLLLDNSFLRFANIGYYANKISFPQSLQAKIVSSDGRPLPTPLDSDSLLIFPGERYGVLINPTVVGTDSIAIDFLNLNTMKKGGSEYIHFGVATDVGIPKFEQSQLRIYPNPVNDFLYIDVDSYEGDFTFSVFDIRGNQLKSGQHSRNINVNDLMSGVYFIQISLENGSQLTQRFLKI